MKLVTRFAVALAVAAAPLAIAAPAFAQALPASVGKPLQAALKAAGSGNSAAAIAQINQAKAAATTPQQKAQVARGAAYVFTRAGQYARAAAELESVGAPASQIASLYYQAGQFGKAAALCRKGGGGDCPTIIGQSLIRSGDFKGAAAYYERLSRANPGNARYLENLAAAQYKLGEKEAYLATTTKLIRIDSSPARWAALLVDMKKAKMSREAKLALFQLMQQTGNIKRADDYQEFVKLAIVAGQPGVAKQALDAGSKAGAFSAGDAQMSSLISATNARAAEAAANASKLPATPAGRFQLGNALLGQGNYTGAAQAFDAAAKGGANADQALVFKGIAQVKAGQTAAARATFNSVPATSGMKDIASLWALYASSRG
ncbi:MAG: tetratricopeptide repeat protein [Alphaproteobacteria bacterium]|nr:tetratricopeptide repeat protein [Alphaproteobacteria bacterium]